MEDKTNVVFYFATYKSIGTDEQPYTEVVAVFVDDVENVINDEKLFSCYVHLGQHSTCCKSFLDENCRKATEEEYKDLFNELTNSIGYNLNVL